MQKIAIIGAGSITFSKKLIGDFLFLDAFKDAEFRLMDIEPERLEIADQMTEAMAGHLGTSCRFITTTDRRKALEDADFVVCMVQVGGHDSTVTDFDVCRRHGVRLTIGDTMGIPAISRALRTAPMMLGLCRDMEELCPNAILLNYTNPMSTIMAIALRGSSIQGVGLCHGVFGTARKLANLIDVPYEKVDYLCAGINHLAFFLRYEVDGKDAYPLIRKAFDTTAKDEELVRQEVFRRFGYFMTESSNHLPEYLPYFIKSDELIKEYDVPIDEYILRSEEGCEIFEMMCKAFREGRNVFMGETEGLSFTPRSRMRSGGHEPGELTGHFVLPDQPSGEYAAGIANAVVTDTPFVFNGNIINHGSITNLPGQSCVEVPCLVDHNGLQPTIVGELPPQCAALIQTNLNVQELVTRAVLEENREHLYHAALMDPLASAVLGTKPIVALMDEMLEAHKDILPDWTQQA
jgi:alpha-galactosidase